MLLLLPLSITELLLTFFYRQTSQLASPHLFLPFLFLKLVSTPFYDLNYSRSFNTPSHELDDSISSSIVLNSTRSDCSSPTCPNPSIIEKNKDNDHEQEVEAINYLAQEDENNLQQQQTLIESRQQESTTDQGVKKFYMGSVKWMSSKMRLMRTMMSSGQTMASSPTNYNSSIPRTHLDSPQSSSDEDDDDHSSSSSLTSNIRVCSDCNTTKTPLWRSGPKGPKSLCNACGIRQRKARRAMAATRGGLLAVKSTPSGRNNEVIEEKISTGQLKSGRRPGRPAMKKQKAIRFDEFSMMSLSKISALHKAHVFPQEEKEAAILLMALSCGSLVT